jgi:hypothetical protein
MTTAVEPAGQPLVRVVRGHLADEELAALTAVLLTRANAPAEAAAEESTAKTPNWQRLERAGGYRAPHSWRR